MTNALQTLSASVMLVPADSGFSVLSLLDNAQTLGRAVGGGIIMLVGLVSVIFGIVKGLMKFFSEREQTSWVKIIAAILLGGAFMVGGINLALSLAEGGQQTIEDLGNGLIVLPFVH